MTDASSPSSNRFTPLSNWVSLTGVVVALASGFAFVLLMIMDFLAVRKGPYLGILTYLVAPFFTALGVGLILLGWRLHRRRLARGGAAPLSVLTLDLSQPRHRRILFAFLLASGAFLLLTALGSYQSYEATKSVVFCGEACHTPMEPQYTAYQFSPHARVDCTDCHIGPGAANAIRAKLNGVNQLFQAARNSFDRPILGHDKMNITREICEQCHWPAKYVGTLDRTYTHFLDDSNNTPYTVRLAVKVGGSDPTHGPVGGIHWHMKAGIKIEFIATDPLKQKIPWVRLTDERGAVTEFRLEAFKEDPARHRIQTMSCVDCHNRLAHQFQAPNDAVDLAMAQGRISPRLPAVRKAAVLALTGEYATPEEAADKIATSLKAAFASHPDLEGTIQAVQTIYRRNFFPAMKTSWKDHPDNIGHKDWPGCFRCHDGEHKTADGKRKIGGSDCNSCHTILAEAKGPLPEQLSAKGLEFKHPEEGWDTMKCHDCHNGSMEK